MAILTPSAENDFWDIKICKITSKMGFLWLKLIYATFHCKNFKILLVKKCCRSLFEGVSVIPEG